MGWARESEVFVVKAKNWLRIKMSLNSIAAAAAVTVSRFNCPPSKINCSYWKEAIRNKEVSQRSSSYTIQLIRSIWSER